MKLLHPPRKNALPTNSPTTTFTYERSGTLPCHVWCTMHPGLVSHCLKLSCWHATWYLTHRSICPWHHPLKIKNRSVALSFGSYLGFVKNIPSHQIRLPLLSTLPLTELTRPTLKLQSRQSQSTSHVNPSYNLTLSVLWLLPYQPPVFKPSSPGY